MYFTDQKLKSAVFRILTYWLGKFTSNFVKMSDFIRIYDFWKKNLVLVCKIHIFGWSVKYTFRLFQISRTTSGFDLKFSPVIGIDHIRPLAKFQVGHVTSWYFTDRSVNYLLSAILTVLAVQITWNFHKMFIIVKCVGVPNLKLVTWLVGILQTEVFSIPVWSVKYQPIMWPSWNLAH